MTNVTQQVGGSIGTALLHTIAAGAVTAFLTGKSATPSLIAQAVVHSYRVAFWWAAGIFSLGSAVTALLLTSQNESPPLVKNHSTGGSGSSATPSSDGGVALAGPSDTRPVAIGAPPLHRPSEA